jgi:hypothetical protein
MTQPQMGLLAQGPLPAGMLRIQQGNQERYVWPVHLPGWLALGWLVAGSSSTAAEPLSQAVPAPAVPLDSEPEPTASRGKRGRRRREEEPQPPAGVEATPEETGTTAETGASDSDPKAAADPGDDSTAEGAVALSALPDDLFSDPLI